jgi:hypothetical protein
MDADQIDIQLVGRGSSLQDLGADVSPPTGSTCGARSPPWHNTAATVQKQRVRLSNL